MRILLLLCWWWCWRWWWWCCNIQCTGKPWSWIWSHKTQCFFDVRALGGCPRGQTEECPWKAAELTHVFVALTWFGSDFLLSGQGATKRRVHNCWIVEHISLVIIVFKMSFPQWIKECRSATRNDRLIYEETSFVFVVFEPHWRGVGFCPRNLRFHVEEEGKGVDPEAFWLTHWHSGSVVKSFRVQMWKLLRGWWNYTQSVDIFRLQMIVVFLVIRITGQLGNVLMYAQMLADNELH